MKEITIIMAESYTVPSEICWKLNALARKYGLTVAQLVSKAICKEMAHEKKQGRPSQP